MRGHGLVPIDNLQEVALAGEREREQQLTVAYGLTRLPMTTTNFPTFPASCSGGREREIFKLFPRVGRGERHSSMRTSDNHLDLSRKGKGREAQAHPSASPSPIASHICPHIHTYICSIRSAPVHSPVQPLRWNPIQLTGTAVHTYVPPFQPPSSNQPTLPRSRRRPLLRRPGVLAWSGVG
ncbi:hypothetical protein BZA05DRAFT_229947 [Tricharina praecox]|uniref:uncharacterized protein n=1 Tax=Tricharina praecox TaxID=43433 RepID=UPI00221F4086|nr:uncharacterized protein BZA05DRAFT_229947 [Tricharina praecox]KAI5841246.1 hypothetical protein BZA05DRAFT_229947 [Tricharina praecox]